MEATIQKTWKPIVAGILNLVAAVVYMLGSVLWFLVATGGHIHWSAHPHAIFWVVVLVITIIVSVVTILGAIYALKRKKWRWVLASSITMSLLYGIGIPALILILISKREFE